MKRLELVLELVMEYIKLVTAKGGNAHFQSNPEGIKAMLSHVMQMAVMGEDQQRLFQQMSQEQEGTDSSKVLISDAALGK